MAAKRAKPRLLGPGVVEALELVDGLVLEDVPELVPVEDVPEAELVEEVGEAALVEAALVPVEVLDEPPQAVSPTQASKRISSAAAAGLRLGVLGWGMKLLCR
jgi:hypothetical protein